MGVCVFTEPQQGASYDQLLAAARATEEAGYEGFFRSDHYLKMGSASGLPAYTDAWTTLAGLARDTSRVRLGTLVTPVTFRHAGSFAVVAAQVDHMSGGRVEVGLGAGWYGDEHSAYGIPFPPMGTRYDALEDQLAILHGAWTGTEDTFSYTGRTCSVTLSTAPLRPAQAPPPIILGGAGGKRGARLAATYAAEFNTAFVPVEVMSAIHGSVRAACEQQGRDPGTMRWSIGQVVCCGTTPGDVATRAAVIGRDVDELKQNGLAGSPQEVLDKIGTFVDAGAERVYLQILDPTDLDHIRLLGAEVVAKLNLP